MIYTITDIAHVRNKKKVDNNDGSNAGYCLSFFNKNN